MAMRAWLGILLIVVNSCTGANPPVQDHALAQVGSIEVREGELLKAMQKQRSNLTPDDVEGLLLHLLENKLLAARSRELGLGDHPEVIRATETALIRAMDESMANEVLGEAETRAAFEQATEEFNHDEQVQLLAILVKDKGVADEVARRATVVGELGFAYLAAIKNDDSELANARGYAGFVARTNARFPKEVIDAAFALGPDQRSSSPIPTSLGFYIIRTLSKRPPLHQTFSEAQPRILQYLTQKRRMETRTSLFESRLRGSWIQDRAALDRILRDPKKVAQPIPQVQP